MVVNLSKSFAKKQIDKLINDGANIIDIGGNLLTWIKRNSILEEWMRIKKIMGYLKKIALYR